MTKQQILEKIIRCYWIEYGDDEEALKILSKAIDKAVEKYKKRIQELEDEVVFYREQ